MTTKKTRGVGLRVSPLTKEAAAKQTTLKAAAARKKLTPKEAAVVAKISPEHQVSAVESLTYVPLEFRQNHQYEPQTEDTKETAVFVNAHRNTCIRVMIGRKKVTYIPLDAEGIMVRRCGIEQFNAEWVLTIADYSPANAASQYLQSYAALRHISEEARTLLEEICKTGALSKSTLSKENTMNATSTTSTATKPAAPTTKPAPVKAPAAKAPAKPAAKAPAKPAAKAPAKPAAKPAAKVPTGGGKGKAVKPAQKSVKPSPAKAKPAPAKAKPAAKGATATKPRSNYAGMKLTALTKDTGARDGSLRHLLRQAVLKSTSADQALGKVIEFEGEEHPITSTILTNMVALKMIKLS